MAYGEGADPRNATLEGTNGTVAGAGYLLMKGTGDRLTLTTGTSSIALGVSAGESERAAGGALDATDSATVSYYPMGGVLMVRSANSMTWAKGTKAYASANGLCNQSAGKAIGVYVGDALVTTDAITLVPISTASAVDA